MAREPVKMVKAFAAHVEGEIEGLRQSWDSYGIRLKEGLLSVDDSQCDYGKFTRVAEEHFDRYQEEKMRTPRDAQAYAQACDELFTFLRTCGVPPNMQTQLISEWFSPATPSNDDPQYRVRVKILKALKQTHLHATKHLKQLKKLTHAHLSTDEARYELCVLTQSHALAAQTFMATDPAGAALYKRESDAWMAEADSSWSKIRHPITEFYDKRRVRGEWVKDEDVEALSAGYAAGTASEAHYVSRQSINAAINQSQENIGNMFKDVVMARFARVTPRARVAPPYVAPPLTAVNPTLKGPPQLLSNAVPPATIRPSRDAPTTLFLPQGRPTASAPTWPAANPNQQNRPYAVQTGDGKLAPSALWQPPAHQTAPSTPGSALQPAEAENPPPTATGASGPPQSATQGSQPPSASAAAAPATPSSTWVAWGGSTTLRLPREAIRAHRDLQGLYFSGGVARLPNRQVMAQLPKLHALMQGLSRLDPAFKRQLWEQLEAAMRIMAQAGEHPDMQKLEAAMAPINEACRKLDGQLQTALTDIALQSRGAMAAATAGQPVSRRGFLTNAMPTLGASAIAPTPQLMINTQGVLSLFLTTMGLGSHIPTQWSAAFNRMMLSAGVVAGAQSGQGVNRREFIATGTTLTSLLRKALLGI